MIGLLVYFGYSQRNSLLDKLA
ncbi:hypothetical protein [Chromobacterium sp. CV08]